MIYAPKTLFMKFLCVVFCGMFSSEGIFPIGCDLSELQLSKGADPAPPLGPTSFEQLVSYVFTIVALHKPSRMVSEPGRSEIKKTSYSWVKKNGQNQVVAAGTRQK